MASLRKNSLISNIRRFKLVNSTTGGGFTGATNASTGLIVSTICDVEATATAYTAAGSTIQSITTLGTYAAPSASDCRFKEVDSTNHPGLYEFQFADARFAVTNAKQLVITVSGITSLLQADYEIQLTSTDVDDAIHGGMSAIPNTAATTNGSLLTSGTGTDQLSVSSGRIDIGKALGTAVTLDGNNVLNVSVKYVGGTLQTARDIGANVLLSSGTGAGQLSITSGVVAASGNWSTYAGGAVASVTAGVTVTTNNDKAGYSGTATNLPADYLSAAEQTYLANANTASGTITTNLNATITSRMATFALPTNFNTLSISGGGVVAASGNWSTYAGADTAGTTTLLTRIPGTVQPQTGDSYAIVNNGTYGNSAVEVLLGGIVSGATPTAITSGSILGIWSSATRTLTADTAGAILGQGEIGNISSGTTVVRSNTSTGTTIADLATLQGVANGSTGSGVNVSSGSIASIIAGIGSGIAAQVWNYSTSLLTLAGSIGKYVANLTGSGPVGANTINVTYQTSSGSPVAGVNGSVNGTGINASNLSGGTSFGLATGNGYVLTPAAIVGLTTFAPVTFNVTGDTSLVVTGMSFTFPSNPISGTVLVLFVATTQGVARPGAVFTFQIAENDSGDNVSDSTTPFYSSPTNSSGGVLVAFPPSRKVIGALGSYPDLLTRRVNKVEFGVGVVNFVGPTILGP